MRRVPLPFVRRGLIVPAVVALLVCAGCRPPEWSSIRLGDVAAVTTDDGITTTVSVERPGYHMKLRADGGVQFSQDESDVASLSPGGSFELRESLDGVQRLYTVRADESGRLTRSFAVRGQAAPLGAEAVAWRSAALARVFRTTGYDAEARVARLDARGGARTVLAEVDRIEDAHCRALYLRELLSRAPLAPTEFAHAMAAAAGVSSDHELRRVLETAVRSQSLDDARATQLLHAARGMDSSYELAEVLTTTISALPAQASVAAHAAWLDAARHIRSDYELRRCLQAALTLGDVDTTFAADVVKLAGRGLHSDYELRTALCAAAPHASDPAVAAAYIGALESLQSDYEKRTALVALVQQAALDHRQVAAALEATASIGSDFERRTALQHLARLVAGDDDLRARYRAIARGLGEYERAQALKALGEGRDA